MTFKEFRKKTKGMNINEFSDFVRINFNISVPFPSAFIDSEYGLYSHYYEIFEKDLKKALKGKKFLKEIENGIFK